MQEEDVKEYLQNHPEFFEKNASLLAEIQLPSPHGKGAISLAERQQLAQRDKIDALKERFAELVINAQENDAIANKIHGFNVELHRAKNFDAIEQLISSLLPEYFELSDTCLRLWVSPQDVDNRANLVFSPLSDDAKNWVEQRQTPYCGLPPEIVAENWFIEPAASIAIVPLTGQQKTIGFLALSSDDAEHFYAEMGTTFLEKIGETISAALSRYLE
jgi:uncharacterized protein